MATYGEVPRGEELIAQFYAHKLGGYHFLGEHSKAAIREHRKTGHTEVVARDVDGAWRQASLQRHEQRIERR